MTATSPWRDRASKKVPHARCCWVCGRLGGNGYTRALAWCGYRHEPGEMMYAHDACMGKAAKEQRERDRHGDGVEKIVKEIRRRDQG